MDSCAGFATKLGPDANFGLVAVGSGAATRLHLGVAVHPEWPSMMVEYNVSTTIINHPFFMVDTTYKNGDHGDGL